MLLTMGKTPPDVDAYIAAAAPFARPILQKVRAAFHRGCPELEERIKWGVPSFEHHGLLGGMAAFRHHVAWGFSRRKELEDPEGILAGEGMFGGGKISEEKQLPSQRVLVAYVKAAARLNEAGPRRRAAPASKAPLRVPAPFQAALQASKKARATFEALAPSHRREYIEWIAGAKRDATRERRIATAIEWLAQGKTQSWRYERRPSRG